MRYTLTQSPRTRIWFRDYEYKGKLYVHCWEVFVGLNREPWVPRRIDIANENKR